VAEEKLVSWLAGKVVRKLNTGKLPKPKGGEVFNKGLSKNVV
jgi:hypothetical protein